MTPSIAARGESFNRCPGFTYEVSSVYQERIDDRIKFFTYAVQR
jgi:hypothetical protein